MLGLCETVRRARPITVAVVDSRLGDYEALQAATLPSLTWRLLGTGREALRLARQEKVDLWLLNIAQTDMSGLDLCTMVKDVCPESVVYIVTDEYCVDDERAALANGACVFVCKPVHAAWLDVRAGKRGSYVEPGLRGSE